MDFREFIARILPNENGGHGVDPSAVSADILQVARVACLSALHSAQVERKISAEELITIGYMIGMEDARIALRKADERVENASPEDQFVMFRDSLRKMAALHGVVIYAMYGVHVEGQTFKSTGVDRNRFEIETLEAKLVETLKQFHALNDDVCAAIKDDFRRQVDEVHKGPEGNEGHNN